ncbi:MAG TPA: LPS export ABC transporter ATP-binding protein [Gemmataceae bacterium]|jgi:lipopolysaccharide export system ATP-binding protein|nr:LPS export ABC transporter ATP-binding protein [Gemmataceae bacterium]
MPILEVRGLVKFYGRRKVVDGVSFDVDAGEVVGLLGPNGAGKTTSFRMTTGQITPQGGRVRFAGHDVTLLPMYKRARLGMGYLAQDTSVFRRLTVEQNVLAILEAMPASRSLKRPLTRKERWQRTDAILDQFGLNKVRKNNAARLSGGEKRRLEIARCLVCEPSLILLDEPFTGIDPITIADIQQIVRGLCRQNIGILLTDHRVSEVLRITDRSYLIKDGQVRTHGTPQQIVNDPIAIREYLGEGFDRTGFDTAASPPAQPEVTVHLVVEHERIRRLIERLRAEDPAAVEELAHVGRAAIPPLLEALERRDVEMRRQAFAVLQRILNGSARFDPYAPESQRRQQLADLRDQCKRKAG